MNLRVFESASVHLLEKLDLRSTITVVKSMQNVSQNDANGSVEHISILIC